VINSIEALVTEHLRRRNGQTTTLSALHANLVDELGAAAGSYHQLYQRLKRCSQRIAVFERPNPVYAVSWPEDCQADYERAMRGAGVDLSPVVTLVPEPDDEAESVFITMRATLLTLAKELQSDAALANEVIGAVMALREVPQVRAETPRPTTPPRSRPR
jgi:hypothetical protein